jgi:hypothetical protein
MMRSLIILVVIAGCAAHDSPTRGVCGNHLLEPGEDCDRDDPTCVRCAITCTTAADCPGDELSCGVDGLCHAPGGAFAHPTAGATFQADDLRVTDIDRDGYGDVIGISKTSLVVRHGNAAGTLATASSFVTPAQSGPPAFSDLDGDGAIDVTLTTLDGIVSYTSPFGTLSPVDIESPILDQESGQPIRILSMFSIGALQLGLFVDDGGSVVLLVVDLITPDAVYAAIPCAQRIGAVPTSQLATSTIDVYRASAQGAAVAQLVVSFATTGGAPCVMAIHGNPFGYTLADVTPAGMAPVSQRLVLADLDGDADPCPGLVRSDAGARALRYWNGTFAAGRCTFEAAGATGAALPVIGEAPPSAVAIGRVPIDPPVAAVAADALVMTSGIYAYSPPFGTIAPLVLSSRKLARVTSADLDNDGDTDAVAAPADEDDLDILYRNGLGFDLLRLDTASVATSLAIADYDANAIPDIAFGERRTGYQALMVAYGTTDRPLAPAQVATFSDIASVTQLEFPDSADPLSHAADLAVIQPGRAGAPPTMTLLHGSTQRTMLSFYDPRSDEMVRATRLRGAVLGNFVGTPHRDLFAIAAPDDDPAIGIRAWQVAGTATQFEDSHSDGTQAAGLSRCDGDPGVCIHDAMYVAWPVAPDRDVVLAIDPSSAIRIDPAGLAATPMPALLAGLPAGAVPRALYPIDLEGDGTLELLASFATPAGQPLAGSVRICTLANGVVISCDELGPAIAPDATCVDAAPARLGTGPALIALCRSGDGGSILLGVTAGQETTLLARGSGMSAIRVGDVTGDGVDDIVAVQGETGSQALSVLAQCTTRDDCTGGKR